MLTFIRWFNLGGLLLFAVVLLSNNLDHWWGGALLESFLAVNLLALTVITRNERARAAVAQKQSEHSRG